MNRTYNYWAPLIALFTGARVGEISQIEVDDIYSHHGIPVININAIGEKSTKTVAGSVR